MKNTVLAVTLILAGQILGGCFAFRQSVKNVDPSETKARDAKYDQEDLLNLATLMSQKILSNKLIDGSAQPPVLVAMGIENRTKSHLDMTALSNTISTKLLDSHKIRIIDPDVRDALLAEQGYQMNNCSTATRVKMGKQLGAQYMMTGALAEIEKRTGRQVRVSKKHDVYYQLTVKLINLETSEVVLSEQIDRLRTASKPLIGW